MIALLGVHTPQGNDQERFVEDDEMSEEDVDFEENFIRSQTIIVSLYGSELWLGRGFGGGA